MAVEALELLKVRKLPQDVGKIHEYRGLIQDLEKELRYALLAVPPQDEER